MKALFLRTFGGLNRSYLIRQYIFAATLGIILLILYAKGNSHTNTFSLIYIVINIMLYPYSRYAYENIVEYIIGNNVFYFNALIMLVVKLFTMVLCFSFAVFVAPVGLAFLFFTQQRKEP